jgi:hypothetical protein
MLKPFSNRLAIDGRGSNWLGGIDILCRQSLLFL